MLDCTVAYGLTFLFPAGDTTVGRCLRDHGEFARAELDFLLDHAAGSGSFVDVGANIGAISLPFAARRPSWHVVAIEAQRPLSGVLAANALNNRLFNVDVANAAAGAAPGLADFPAVGLESRGNLGTIRFGMPGVTEPVRMLTLDGSVAPNARLIKVDVEGFELQVLEGAQALLRRGEALWVVEATAQRPDLHAEVIALFQAAGYSTHWFYSPFATPAAAKAPARSIVGDVSIVALPSGAPNLWQLSPILTPTSERPTELAAYPYLSRYGY